MIKQMSSNDHRLMSLQSNASSPCYLSSVPLLNTVLINVTKFGNDHCQTNATV